MRGCRMGDKIIYRAMEEGRMRILRRGRLLFQPLVCHVQRLDGILVVFGTNWMEFFTEKKLGWN